ncbi:Transcription initiation factor TFIID subunit 9 [Willisornis vidua]|uniref:Transcription initiation factor TFIID subunit 9 n=1 Tax=Willisornis vidua TaxID=1566151 RepID=A0ABQ9DKC5_9PASS|nr:Transcription initiation factor TFIID subunit 9 [Willisornis vidua]
MEAAKMASPKSAPKDAQVMAQILKDMGITEYEPRVINQMLEFAYKGAVTLQAEPCWQCQAWQGGLSWAVPSGYVTTILEDAKIYSSHAKKSSVDADDVRLAIQCRTDQSFTSPPPRDVSSTAGRITVPRLSVGAVSSRPSTPTLGTPSAQAVSVSAKVGAPVSLAGQRFTVQIPPSQPTGKSATPTTPTVQNVLINPSLIGPKNILITTNMVSQGTASDPNPLKRKHEDEDDYDTL